ncbi:MAG: polysaccharide biosynthesis tyrosine autokinase [Acidobacteria bacterium]|nr:polysaccharide biosynthesis tyrosine autokinase [Acidobacteriota bacterium]
MSGSMDGGHQQNGFSPAAVIAKLSEERLSDVWHRRWRIIRNRRWEILGVFIVGLFISGFIAYRTQPLYKATGTIAIEPARQRVMVGVQDFNTGGQDVYEGPLIKMQLDVLQSRMLAERVMDKLKLWQRPEPRLSGEKPDAEREAQRTQRIDVFLGRLSLTRASEGAGQRVIRVNYTSQDGRLAAEAINALFESFIAYNRESSAQAVEFAQDWLTQQLAELEDKLQKSRQTLLAYQQNMESISLGDVSQKENVEENPLLKQFSRLNEDLGEAESAHLRAGVLYRRAQEQGIEALPLSTAGDTRVAGLKQQRDQLTARLSELRSKYQDTSSPVLALRRQIDDLDAQIKAAEQQGGGSLLRNLNNEYEVTGERARGLRELVQKQRAGIMAENRDALQFSLLKREAEVDEKLFQMLSERLREAELMSNLAPSTNVRIIDRAETPLLPVNSKATPLFRGALISLLIAFAVGFLLEFLDDRVKTVEDVETMLKLASLGVIPLANGEGESSLLSMKRARMRTPITLIGNGDGRPLFAEAYRTLRTSVLLSSATRPPQTMVVTSHQAGAGKTTTALNMSIALAQAGKRVLLIDGDMRHPGCAQALGVEGPTGLSTHLSFSDQPAAIYHDCKLPGLDLLPAGSIPPNPSELLSSEKIRLLMTSMATRYDHIIIDTPPLGLVSDALIFSALADGVMLVIRSEQNSRRGILRVKESLHTINAKILGVVLNAVDVRRHEYGYYGYGYGSYYYPGEGTGPGKGKAGERSGRKAKDAHV